MPVVHHFEATVTWTGNQGAGTSTYRAYSRSHEIGGSAKASAIAGSSDPAFRGDKTRYSPEDLLVGALAACHMLWVLHLCAEARITVVDYVDIAPVHHGAGNRMRDDMSLRMWLGAASVALVLGGGLAIPTAPASFQRWCCGRESR